MFTQTEVRGTIMPAPGFQFTLITTDSRWLPFESTVFQAEILAIHIALIRLNEILQPQDQYIKLFNDTQAAIQALNSHKIKSLK